MKVNSINLPTILKFWFSKAILDYSEINFEDNIIYKNALDIFIYDYKRCYPADDIIIESKITAWAPLISVLTYRIAREYFLTNNESVALLYSNLGKYLTGIEIYYTANIGKRFRINHGVGTVIGAHTIIGDDCLVHQNVTFGKKDNNDRPKIKNNVTIYAGAKIIGGIEIGNNCTIAANCVCFIDVPDNKTVVGIPAKIL